MKIKFLLLFFFFPLFLNAQEIADSVYWVYFRDKDGSKYQIDQAKEFLSERSLNRRAWQGIGVDQRDLPVNGDYVQAIKDLGIEVRHVSRWLNGAVFVNADSAQFEEVLSMEFIDTLAWMPESNDRYFPQKTMGERFSPPLETSPDFSYGIAMEQVTMLKTDRLHDLGYTGKGVWIAVLDGGFNNVDSLPSFEALIAEDRLVGTRNFVNDRHVFREGSTHGMSVLSTMGGEWDGYLVGTAPHASYLLCTTENTAKETRIEEIAWIEAAEYADSLGFDVINTSLGYSNMDGEAYDYSYSDMDGQTTYISRAASLAASRGMIAVNSAGNQGNSDWYYITAPADATDILAVGAVDSTNFIGSFSSRGPTFDARIKPDVTAMGVRSGVQSRNGGVSRSSGTSFSSPVLAGSVASLWQAYPDLTAKEMIHFVRQGGDRRKNPDSVYGFGLPDFFWIYFSITGLPIHSVPGHLEVYPNPASQIVMVKIPGQEYGMRTLEFYDFSGRKVHVAQSNLPGQVHLPNKLTPGIYILAVHTNRGVFRSRLMIE